MPENAIQYMAAFVIFGIVFVGFFLIFPSSYDILNATDLGAGNETLDTAYGLLIENQSVYGWIFIAVAALAVLSTVVYLWRGAS